MGHDTMVGLTLQMCTTKYGNHAGIHTNETNCMRGGGVDMQKKSM